MRPMPQRRLKSTITDGDAATTRGPVSDAADLYATAFGGCDDVRTDDRDRDNDRMDASTLRAISGLSPLGALERTGSGTSPSTDPVDRFVEEQLFEEDVRAVLSMMRPHRRERLMGWSEYRTGGAHFRATISWDPAFEKSAQSQADRELAVPRLTDVLESILVGSVKNQDELHAAEEFEIYRGVVRELYRRLDEMQSCYE